MAYATRENVYDLGLDSSAFARPARLVEGVIQGTGTIALRAHGLATDAPLTLSVLSSSVLGAPAAALPGGLSVGTVYYAKPNGGSLFQLAATSGGSAIPSFTDAGSGAIGVVFDHERALDAALDAATAAIDQFARAHAAPIQAAVLPLLCAFLAVRIYVAAHAALNPAFTAALETAPNFLRDKLDKLFDAYLSGAPILGAVDATPTIEENAARSVHVAVIDWGTGSEDRV